MSYKLIIFDWDGTLMDSAAKIVSSMQLAAQQCQVEIPSAESVGNIIGISLKPAIMKLFNTEDEQLTDRLVEAYKHAFVELDSTPSPLFEGVEVMLDDLKTQGKTLTVATGKARRGLDRAWRNTATGHYFTASRCADDAQSKPSPDMLTQLLDELNLKPADAVMVGDTVYDMQMAEAIGMDRIGVSYGVHAQVHLEVHEPIAIVHSIPELHALLNQSQV